MSWGRHPMCKGLGKRSMRLGLVRLRSGLGTVLVEPWCRIRRPYYLVSLFGHHLWCIMKARKATFPKLRSERVFNNHINISVDISYKVYWCFFSPPPPKRARSA